MSKINVSNENIQKLIQNNTKFVSDIQELKKTCTTLQKISPDVDATLGAMTAIFEVMKESIEEQNEDKEMWLEKLEMYEEMGDALSDYLSELNDVIMQADGKPDDTNKAVLKTSAKGIKKAISPLGTAVKVAKTGKDIKMQKDLADLKKAMLKIRKSIKPPKKISVKIRKRKTKI